MNDPFWFITWLFNEVLAFLAIAFIVQGVFIAFRIKNPRIRAFVRTLPLIGLVIDPLLHPFSIGHFLNPLSCESSLQMVTLYFFPELKSYLVTHEISLTQYLITQFSPVSITTILIAFGTLTATLFLCGIFRIWIALHQLKYIAREAENCRRPIENNKLKEQLQCDKIEILASDQIDAPMAMGRRTILVPRKVLEVLAQDEFEAMLAHELAHLRSWDPMIRLFTQILSGFFWWIPTHWWLKRMEEDQEMACDESVKHYTIQREALAFALVKVARISRDNQRLVFCKLVDNPIVNRLKMILDTTMPFKEKWLWPGGIALAVGLFKLVGCIME
jgi:beta-lactamase regulating signal transducer with metallopeptidase domain